MRFEPKRLWYFIVFFVVVPVLALDLNFSLENIKLHGHWKSNAVWNYLTDILKSAPMVANTFFKKMLSNLYPYPHFFGLVHSTYSQFTPLAKGHKIMTFQGQVTRNHLQNYCSSVYGCEA